MKKEMNQKSEINRLKNMKRYLLIFLLLLGGGSLMAQTVSSLSATGTGIKWYSASSGGTLYTGTEPLVNGTTYYASQTVNGQESATRFAVTATVNANPAATTSAAHVAAQAQIVWNWTSVSGATGYKWNTTNTYGSATDMGNTLTNTETGLTCNTAYSRYVWAYNASGCVSGGTTLTQSTSVCLSDAIRSSLSTSQASYDAAAANSLVKITSVEYEDIVTNLTADRIGYLGPLNSGWATSYTSNSTFSYNSNANATTTSTFSSSNWAVAVSFIPALNPQGSFTCQLKYNLSNSLTDITNLYSGATAAVQDRQYLAIKRPSVQLPGSATYVSFYSSSGIATNWTNGWFDMIANNLSGVVSGWTTITNSPNAVPTIQVLQTATKQW
jgi:hypothetical protein